MLTDEQIEAALADDFARLRKHCKRTVDRCGPATNRGKEHMDILRALPQREAALREVVALRATIARVEKVAQSIAAESGVDRGPDNDSYDQGRFDASMDVQCAIAPPDEVTP